MIAVPECKWKTVKLGRSCSPLPEGQPVHLYLPRNQFPDIVVRRATNISVRIGSNYTAGSFNTTEQIENEVMVVRWKFFEFSHLIQEAD